MDFEKLPNFFQIESLLTIYEEKKSKKIQRNIHELHMKASYHQFQILKLETNLEHLTWEERVSNVFKMMLASSLMILRLDKSFAKVWWGREGMASPEIQDLRFRHYLGSNGKTLQNT